MSCAWSFVALAMEAGEYVFSREFVWVFVGAHVGLYACDEFILVVGADQDLAVFAGHRDDHVVSSVRG